MNFFVFYIAAFVVDVVLGVCLIAIPLLAISLEASPFQLGLIGFTHSLFYLSFTFFFGRLSDRIKPMHLPVLGCVIYCLISLLFSFLPSLAYFYLFMAIMGISMAMFWPALEAWLAHSAGEENLLRPIGYYNIAWCAGLAVGSLVGGILFQYSPRLPFYFAILATGITVLFLVNPIASLKRQRKLIDKSTSNVSLKVESNVSEFSPRSTGNECFLYIAYLANFISWFILGVVRYLFPRLTAQLGISAAMLGFLMFLMGMAQTVCFFFLSRTTKWHYRLPALIILQILMGVGMLIIFFSRSVFLFILAFVLIGSGTGMSYYSSIFYSLRGHSDKGAKSGIHEMVLGAGGLCGALLGGILAQSYTLRIPYLFSSFLLVGTILAEIFLVKKNKKSA